MAAEGKNVTVELVEFGGSDEELKQQYALDLGAGAGYDVFAFDGFWVPGICRCRTAEAAE